MEKVNTRVIGKIIIVTVKVCFLIPVVMFTQDGGVLATKKELGSITQQKRE